MPRTIEAQRAWLLVKKAEGLPPKEMVVQAPCDLFPNGIPYGTAHYYGRDNIPMGARRKNNRFEEYRYEIARLRRQNTQLAIELQEAKALTENPSPGIGAAQLSPDVDPVAFEQEKQRQRAAMYKRDKAAMRQEMETLRSRNMGLQETIQELREKLEEVTFQNEILEKRILHLRQELRPFISHLTLPIPQKEIRHARSTNY